MGWLGGVPDLNRPHSPQMYRDDLGPHHDRIRAAVLVEAAVDADGLDRELDWLLEVREGPGPIESLVVGWQPRGDRRTTVERLDRLENLDGVVGLREVLHGDGEASEAPRDRGLLESVRMAGDRGFVVDLCVRPDQLEATEWLIGQAPGTRFMLDHLGRPNVGGPLDPGWKDAMARLGDLPQVHAKFSGLLECADGGEVSVASCRPVLDHVLACFGPDRLAWGSNWPVCHQVGAIAAWVDLTEQLLAEHADPVRASILGGTAARFYGLSIPGD